MKPHQFEVEQSVKVIHLEEIGDTEPEFTGAGEISGSIDRVSLEDRFFLDMIEKKTLKADDHYGVSLQSRNKRLVMLNNREQTFRRLTSLKQKFLKDQKFIAEHEKFLDNKCVNDYCKEKELYGASPNANVIKDVTNKLIPYVENEEEEIDSSIPRQGAIT